MRRKTIAKRILYNGYEGYEKTPEDTGARANHVFSQEPAKRRKWRGLNGEDISSCNADYIKFKTKAFEVDKPLGDATRDADFTMEVLGSLQSRSRAELIAMVLSMQREMDCLREQIRSLTACGKLAQTLEELIERSDRWLCGSHEAATPSIPREPERSRPPSHISPPTVLSGRTDERASSEQQGCGQYEVTQTMQTQRNGTLLEQKVITADLLERCNTGTTAQKLTNDLLRSLYDRDCLASHSISGIVNSKRGTPKPALPAHEIQAILRTVQRFFPGKTDSEIKGYIRQKLQNEAKRLRKRPHPADDPLVGSFKEAGTTVKRRTVFIYTRAVHDLVFPVSRSGLVCSKCSTTQTLCMCSARLWSHGEKISRTGSEETEPSGQVLDATVSYNGQLLPRQQREEEPDVGVCVAAGGRSQAPVNLHLVARESERDSQAEEEAEEKG
ncbi:BEN domain-containing protein 6 [Chanodichthys erythropterus]|uniref:BEN domain-containing protein 6 n=1 Tax=Chanodichthys erythropterus TaxID=933992 RepID=UPI00351ED2C4